MFNVSQLYSTPNFLRGNVHSVKYNKLSFISMKEKKTDRRFFFYISCRILAEKYNNLQRKVNQWLVLGAIRCSKIHLLLNIVSKKLT